MQGSRVLITMAELCATTGSQCIALHSQMGFGWWVQTL